MCCTGLCTVCAQFADQRHARDLRSARQREHHVRTERGLHAAGGARQAAAQDGQRQGQVTGRGQSDE